MGTRDKDQIGKKEKTKQANSTMDPIETWEYCPIQCEEKTLEKNKIKVVNDNHSFHGALYLKQQQQRLTIIVLSILFSTKQSNGCSLCIIWCALMLLFRI